MYYIFIKDEKINGCGQCQCLNEDYSNLEVTEEVYNAFVENPNKYVYQNGEIVENPNYEQERRKLEQDKINHLTCTALDLAMFIKQAGLTDSEVVQFLNANPSLQLQLTLCKDVYCGVVRQLCPLKITETLTLTDDMVVGFFKKKHNIK